MSKQDPGSGGSGLQRHIDPDELAVLVGQGLQGTIPAPAREHLANCPRCLALFAELSRAHLDQATENLPYTAPPDLVAQARALAADGESASPPVRSARPAWQALGAGLAAVLALLALLGPWSPWHLSGQHPNGSTALQQALAADSQHGLVHLAVAPDQVRDAVVYRSGTQLDRPAVRSALARLTSGFDPAAPDPDVSYQRAAGHIALAQLGLARNLLDEARLLFPRDWRFEFLAAHVAYKESDLATARRLLDDLVAAGCDQPEVIFNRALVLQELGDPAGREILRGLTEREPGSFLAARAAGLLGDDNLD